MNLNQLKSYAPQLTRYAIALVFLLLGIDQILHPALWQAYFPDTIPFGITVAKAIFFNGLFDIVIGLLLLLGLFTRIAAALAALHIVGVIFTLGYNDITVRDLGILVAALAVFLHGADRWCLYPNEKE